MSEDNAAQQGQRQVEVHAQYVKDLSFESPKAPSSLVMASQQPPQIELSVNITAEKMQETHYEVTLHLTATAVSKEDKLFLVDVAYAGLFSIHDVPEDQRELLLFVFCPTILFPFARQIIADATRNGGFPPLMVNPMDFLSLYHQRAQQSGVEATVQ
jgi:preprotein translocase subunit SecB